MTTHRFVLGCGILLISTGISGVGAQGHSAKRPTPTAKNDPKTRAIEFCRDQALTRFKYQKTVDWEASPKDEGGGLFLIVGFRDAKAPAGDTVTQQVTCRVERIGSGWKLRLIQIFKESSRTDKDVFETYR